MGRDLARARSGLTAVALVFAIPAALSVILAATLILLFGVGLSAALSRLGTG